MTRPRYVVRAYTYDEALVRQPDFVIIDVVAPIAGSGIVIGGGHCSLASAGQCGSSHCPQDEAMPRAGGQPRSQPTDQVVGVVVANYAQTYLLRKRADSTNTVCSGPGR